MKPPNLILEELYRRYYEVDNTDERNSFISSHWEQEGELLSAIRTGSGEVMPESISYWGCRWSSLRARGLDVIHRYSHFLGLTNKARVHQLTGVARKLCRRMGLDMTHTVFRQLCTVELVERHLSIAAQEERLRFLVIGDGAGVLSGLLKEVFADSSITLVDIGKTLLYQAYHLQRAFPNQRHSLVGDGIEAVDSDLIYCSTEDLEKLEDFDFDVCLNVASMQEMNHQTIKRYFDFMRSHLINNKLFYCCNRESKILVGGEISEFYSYPWDLDDEILVDSECPWHRYAVGLNGPGNGPKLIGIPIPFLKFYDGRILHRLAVMSTNNQNVL